MSKLFKDLKWADKDPVSSFMADQMKQIGIELGLGKAKAQFQLFNNFFRKDSKKYSLIRDLEVAIQKDEESKNDQLKTQHIG